MYTSLRSPIRLGLLALALGLAADRLFVGRWIGISAPLFMLGGLLALAALNRVEGQRFTGNSWLLGAGALLFAALLAVRDTPTLVLLNLAACSGLLMLLVASFRGVSLLQVPLLAAVMRLLLATAQIAFTPITLLVHVFQSLPVGRARLGAALPFLRGLLLALPLLLLFGGLLAAADSVFGSYMAQLFTWRIPFDPSEWFGHGLFIAATGWICAGGLTTALTLAPLTQPGLPAEGDTQRLHAEALAWRPLGLIEALTVLLTLDGLFAVFVAVQGAYLFGGMNTLDRTGMTFADYARRGFFELVFVACLALSLLLVLALLTRRAVAQRRGFNSACVVMVALVLVMLVSAFQRMWLYEQAYGFTELRFYTHSFMIWLAVILVLFVVALLRNTMHRFIQGSLVTALVYVLALNLVNPLDLIVRANVASHAAGATLDVEYLGTLAADATPALVASLDQVDAESRAALQSYLAEHRLTLAQAAAEQGWPSWNLARARQYASN